MQRHETVIILRPDLTKEERDNLIKVITDKVNEKGKLCGEIQQKEKALAYTIKGYNRGYYITFEFDMKTNLIKDIELFLRKPQIIKYIIVKVV